MASRRPHSTRAMMPRIPFTPFLPYVRHGQGVGGMNRDDGKYGHQQVAEALGVSRRTLSRYMVEGLPVDLIETLCHFIGRHPVEVLGRGHAGLMLLMTKVVEDPILGPEVEEFRSDDRERQVAVP